MVKSNFITILIGLLFLGIVNLSSSQLLFKKGAPHVKLNQGFYYGAVKSSRGGQHYYEFLGLRYANPNPKRFQPPEPLTIEHSKERIPAITPGSKCLQQFGQELVGSEDCLFLNVHVPMKDPPQKDGFPVMFFIHGGAFTFSSGDAYDPKYFMDEEIIVVTSNYRLGAFGFLSTEDEIVPGNMGLKDQVLALKWVKENLKNFGGNVNQITVFGNSAGAASVALLLLSPMVKEGLFHAAIAQSGSTNNFWAHSHKPLPTAKELAKTLECSTESSKALVECLESKTAEEIMFAQSRLNRWFVDPITPFGPTVEMKTEGSIAFLSDWPDNIMENREFYRVPLMLGVTQDEGLTINAAGVMNNPKLVSQLDSDFNTIAPITFNYKDWFPHENLNEISQKIREYYFGDKSIDGKTFQNLTNLYSDANFVYGVWKFALSYATENPVYPYVLTFLDGSSLSLTKLFTGKDEKLGVAHGDELQYLFKSNLFPQEVPKDSNAEKFSKLLVKLWVSFARHRKPIETWGSERTWPSISKAQLDGDKKVQWYQLDMDTKIIEDPFLARKKFWDKLFKNYSKPIELKNEKQEL